MIFFLFFFLLFWPHARATSSCTIACLSSTWISSRFHFLYLIKCFFDGSTHSILLGNWFLIGFTRQRIDSRITFCRKWIREHAQNMHFQIYSHSFVVLMEMHRKKCNSFGIYNHHKYAYLCLSSDERFTCAICTCCTVILPFDFGQFFQFLSIVWLNWGWRHNAHSFVNRSNTGNLTGGKAADDAII